MPIIRSSITAVAASGLPLERGGSSAVGRGRAGRPARPRPRDGIDLSVLWVAYANHNTLKSVPTLPR